MNIKQFHVVLMMLIIVSSSSVWCQQQEASLAVTQLFSWYSALTGRFTGVSWWISANSLAAVVEYASRTQNNSFTSVIENMYLKNGVPFIDTEGYDDIQWWGLAMVHSYKLTTNKDYLTRAEEIFSQAQGAWDTTCGGGVWWDRKKTYKNAITNELFLSLAAELYLATNQSSYLTWAQEEWKWFSSSGLINSNYLVNDGLVTATCKNNGETTWTYNQGVVLGGLATLYTATGNKTYLAAATQVANAAISSLSKNGILQELCEPNNCNSDQTQFKGIFIRNLNYLYQATQNQQFWTFITSNANSIWNNDRSGSALGLKWGGPFDSQDPSRQSSALDALIAAIPL